MRRHLPPAFTLIEALLVAIIFAIVAGLAYQNSWRVVEKARIKGAWSILRLVDAAAKSRYRDQGAFPDDIDQLSTDGYIDNPNQGQTDWDYRLRPGGPNPQWVQATRLRGACAGKVVRRYFRTANDGIEDEPPPFANCP